MFLLDIISIYFSKPCENLGRKATILNLSYILVGMKVELHSF